MSPAYSIGEGVLELPSSPRFCLSTGSHFTGYPRLPFSSQVLLSAAIDVQSSILIMPLQWLQSCLSCVGATHSADSASQKRTRQSNGCRRCCLPPLCVSVRRRLKVHWVRRREPWPFPASDQAEIKAKPPSDASPSSPFFYVAKAADMRGREEAEKIPLFPRVDRDHARLNSFPLLSNVQLAPLVTHDSSQVAPHKAHIQLESGTGGVAHPCHPTELAGGEIEYRDTSCPSSETAGVFFCAEGITENGSTSECVVSRREEQDENKRSHLSLDKDEVQGRESEGREEHGGPREIVVVLSWKRREKRTIKKRRRRTMSPHIFTSPSRGPASLSSPVSSSSYTASGSSVGVTQDKLLSESSSGESVDACDRQSWSSGKDTERTKDSEDYSLSSALSSKTFSPPQSVFPSVAEKGDTEFVTIVNHAWGGQQNSGSGSKIAEPEAETLAGNATQKIFLPLNQTCSTLAQQSQCANQREGVLLISSSNCEGHRVNLGTGELNWFKEAESNFSATTVNKELGSTKAVDGQGRMQVDLRPQNVRSSLFPSCRVLSPISSKQTPSTTRFSECKGTVTRLRDITATKVSLNTAGNPVRLQTRLISLLPFRRAASAVKLLNGHTRPASLLTQHSSSSIAAQGQSTPRPFLSSTSGCDLTSEDVAFKKGDKCRIPHRSSTGAGPVDLQQQNDAHVSSLLPHSAPRRCDTCSSRLQVLPSLPAAIKVSPRLPTAANKGIRVGHDESNTRKNGARGRKPAHGREPPKYRHCWTQRSAGIGMQKCTSRPLSSVQRGAGDSSRLNGKHGCAEGDGISTSEAGRLVASSSCTPSPTCSTGHLSHLCAGSVCSASTTLAAELRKEEKKDAASLTKIGGGATMRAGKTTEHQQARQQQTDMGNPCDSHFLADLDLSSASCKRAVDAHDCSSSSTNATPSPRTGIDAAERKNLRGTTQTRENEGWSSSAATEEESLFEARVAHLQDDSRPGSGLSPIFSKYVGTTSVSMSVTGLQLVSSSSSSESRPAFSRAHHPSHKKGLINLNSSPHTQDRDSTDGAVAVESKMGAKRHFPLAAETCENHATALLRSGLLGQSQVKMKEKETSERGAAAAEKAPTEGGPTQVDKGNVNPQHRPSERAEHRKLADEEEKYEKCISLAAQYKCMSLPAISGEDIGNQRDNGSSTSPVDTKVLPDPPTVTEGAYAAESIAPRYSMKTIENAGSGATSLPVALTAATAVASCAHENCPTLLDGDASYYAIFTEKTADCGSSSPATAEHLNNVVAREAHTKDGEIAKLPCVSSPTRQFRHSKRSCSPQSQTQTKAVILPAGAATVCIPTTAAEHGADVAASRNSCERGSVLQICPEARAARPLPPAALRLKETTGETAINAEILSQTERVLSAVGLGFASVMEMGAVALRSLLALDIASPMNTNTGDSAAVCGTPVLCPSGSYTSCASCSPSKPATPHAEPVRKLCAWKQHEKQPPTDQRATCMFPAAAHAAAASCAAVISSQGSCAAASSTAAPCSAPHIAMTCTAATGAAALSRRAVNVPEISEHPGAARVPVETPAVVTGAVGSGAAGIIYDEDTLAAGSVADDFSTAPLAASRFQAASSCSAAAPARPATPSYRFPETCRTTSLDCGLAANSNPFDCGSQDTDAANAERLGPDCYLGSLRSTRATTEAQNRVTLEEKMSAIDQADAPRATRLVAAAVSAKASLARVVRCLDASLNGFLSLPSTLLNYSDNTSRDSRSSDVPTIKSCNGSSSGRSIRKSRKRFCCHRDSTMHNNCSPRSSSNTGTNDIRVPRTCRRSRGFSDVVQAGSHVSTALLLCCMRPFTTKWSVTGKDTESCVPHQPGDCYPKNPGLSAVCRQDESEQSFVSVLHRPFDVEDLYASGLPKRGYTSAVQPAETAAGPTHTLDADTSVAGVTTTPRPLDNLAKASASCLAAQPSLDVVKARAAAAAAGAALRPALAAAEATFTAAVTATSAVPADCWGCQNLAGPTCSLMSCSEAGGVRSQCRLRRAPAMTAYREKTASPLRLALPPSLLVLPRKGLSISWPQRGAQMPKQQQHGQPHPQGSERKTNENKGEQKQGFDQSLPDLGPNRPRPVCTNERRRGTRTRTTGGQIRSWKYAD